MIYHVSHEAKKKIYDGGLLCVQSKQWVINHNTRLDNKYWNYKIKYGGIIAKTIQDLIIYCLLHYNSCENNNEDTGIWRYETGDILWIWESYLWRMKICKCVIYGL